MPDQTATPAARAVAVVVPGASGICPECQRPAPLVRYGRVGHHSVPMADGRRPRHGCVRCCGGVGRKPLPTPTTERIGS